MKTSTWLLALCLALLPTGSMAKGPPPPPEGGLTYTHQGNCKDDESGELGYCYLAHDKAGIFYLIFWQKGELMLIRQVTETGYITLWERAKGELA